MTTARLARPADTDHLAKVLTDVFAEDPLMRWLVPDDRAWQHAAAFFKPELRTQIASGQVFTTDDRVGAAIWMPPGRTAGWSELLAMLPALPGLVRVFRPGRIRDGLAVLGALKKNRPKTEHWYLSTLGVDPTVRSRGIGAALISPVLRRCDLDGVGAYLESSNPANVPFYRRNGFEVMRAITPGGSPPVTLMWRDPVAVDPAADGPPA